MPTINLWLRCLEFLIQESYICELGAGRSQCLLAVDVADLELDLPNHCLGVRKLNSFLVGGLLRLCLCFVECSLHIDSNVIN